MTKPRRVYTSLAVVQLNACINRIRNIAVYERFLLGLTIPDINIALPVRSTASVDTATPALLRTYSCMPKETPLTRFFLG
jgi:hypothetical protein